MTTYTVGQAVLYTLHFTFNGHELAPSQTLGCVVCRCTAAGPKQKVTLRLPMNNAELQVAASDPNLRPAS